MNHAKWVIAGTLLGSLALLFATVTKQRQPQPFGDIAPSPAGESETDTLSLRKLSNETRLSAQEATDLQIAQESYRTKNNKYQAFTPDELRKGLKVDEYISPDGTPGYQVFEYDLRSDGLYYRSWGEGQQAVERSHDWIKLWNATSTP